MLVALRMLTHLISAMPGWPSSSRDNQVPPCSRACNATLLHARAQRIHGAEPQKFSTSSDISAAAQSCRELCLRGSKPPVGSTYSMQSGPWQYSLSSVTCAEGSPW